MKPYLLNLKDYLLSSVKRKMILIIAASLVVIIGAIVIVTYQVSVSLQFNDAKANDASKVRFISNNIDEVVFDVNRFIDSLTQDTEIQSVISDMVTTNVVDVGRLERLVLSKAIYYPDMFNSIYLFNQHEQLTRLKLDGPDNVSDEPLTYNKYRYDTIGRTTWRIDSSTVYVEKAIRHFESLKTIGYISIEINKPYLRSRLQSDGKRYTYVYDENGVILIESHENTGIDTEQLFDLAKQELNDSPKVVSVTSGNKMLLTTHLSKYGKWRVVSVVPLSDIAKAPGLIRQWSLLIGTAGALLGIVILWVFFSRLIAPLHVLKKLMDMAEIDNFQPQASINRRDEFGRLVRSFNHMMRKINYLISEVYQKEIAQRESEYKALKAQINPHFLYNTLDTIRWLAMYGEAHKVEKVAVSLAMMMKASMKDSKDMTTIRSEVELIEAYVAIQDHRFGHRIQVSIHIDERIMDLYIPRFILQPIVENSYIHGLEPKSGEGRLMIQGALHESGVIIRVMDNGVGMQDNLVASMLAGKMPEANVSATGSGSGMRNVHERIRALFGNSYGLSVHSSIDNGTIVELLLPAIHHSQTSHTMMGG